MFYLKLQSKITDTWENLTDKTVSEFLNIKGWPFNDKTFIHIQMGSKNIDKKLSEVELSKHGQCYVFKDFPAQTLEGPAQ